MRILVTGATGFVGRHLVQQLCREHEVIAVARTEGRVASGIECVRWDLSEDLPLQILPERVDAIVHLAQSDRYREFPEGADDLFKVNVASTASLLDYAWRAKAKNFLFTSTGSVYEPYLGSMSETARVRPKTGYGVSKVAAEVLLCAYADLYNICTLRLFFPFGPGQTRRLIPNLIARIREGAPISLAGKGGGLRISPTYIDDVVAVIHRALVENWTATINVAAPEIVSLKSIGEIIGKQLQKDVSFEWTGGQEPVTIAPDLACLRDLYVVEEFTAVETGLARTLGES